ncbi:LCP family protein [Terrisporobacter glycolicus]|uniref:Polyisoprenyl-teichoic acid--peptidoglycan teichoic acid transferase TagU n=1 Tax=Terrisporobacter glycolicus ATCC 14880 = DSM 1288 TaxID=1121315 RepID=A0ABZ2EUV2_9FIRM|nr:LCP family protein [Terrisporobacter glycolicus]
MSRGKKIVIALVLVLLLLPMAVFGFLYYRINNVNTDQQVEGVTNILLLGTDGRENESAYRSDCMMILTIDNTHKSVKLTSLARDTYVEIPGEGKGKLNASYFWGKEQLLFKTIKSEFGIEIDKFIQIDFEGLMDVITKLGGVEVDISKKEMKAVNKLIPSTYESYNNPDKGEMKLISSSGVQTLTGYQAISYCRIRDIDSAIYRDGRQRKVIMGVASKLKGLSLSEYPKLIKSLLPCVSTNMGSIELLNLGTSAYKILSKDGTIKQGQFPIIDEVHSKGGKYKDAGWVWLYDKNSVVVLKQFIFDDIPMENNKYLSETNKIELND